MPINWEAVASIASLISTIAVLAAVVVGIRQVRVGAQQVDHLRRTTQLEGTMKIFAQLGSPEQVAARRFVAMELPIRLRDPEFRAEMAHISYAANLEEHHELAVLRLMEMIGVYIKHGLLDEEIVFDFWIPAVQMMWEELDGQGVIAAHRQTAGADMWANFEDLYRRAARWEAKHDGGAPPKGYLANVPRPHSDVEADATVP
jgi:hypothetical protein